MYTNFFSLSEPPFSIAPDPKYLFMSDRHREALTHLMHGLGCSSTSSNGGFVLLTGEVGTGKTTVSRCLMADLPENTQLAFILNPTLSNQELLATICDQLKIRYRKTGATLKTLTDKISEKLLKNHANGINTILIIDEAQHLEPQVLEQLRLLTNLETDTKKLLQVILIGQPELQQLLKRRDLRQLAQRITARYHLLPLDEQELVSYIKHRLSIADCHRALFNKSALATIHKLSQGIPRVINLICHSALMEAYNSNNAVIDKKIVLKAASHALGDDFLPPIWWQKKNSQIALIISMLFMVLVIGFWLGQKEQIPLEKSPIEQLPINSSNIRERVLPDDTAQKIETKAIVKPKEEASSVEGKPPKVQQKELDNKTEKKSVELDPSGDVPASMVETNVDKAAEKEQVQITVSAERSNTAQMKTVPNKVISNNAKVENNYQVEAVEGVSDDLLARFQSAMDETKEQSIPSQQPDVTQNVDSKIKPLTQMPTLIQNSVPNLRFEQHIYASNGEGWVNVNGRDRYEGDMIAPELQLSEILPQQVVLIFRGEKFSLPALSNW